MFKKKYFLIIIIVVIAVGGYFGYQALFVKKVSPYIWTEAKIGDIREIVSETGTVKAAKDINLNFKNVGTIKAIKVKVGDNVKAGDSLVVLDTSDLEIQARQARANRDSAKAKLDLLLAGASVEDIKIYETAVANAKDNLERARKNLANAEATAEANLDNVYKTARVTMQGNIVVMSSALTDMDNILGVDNTIANDAFETYLGVLSQPAKNAAENAYESARDSKLAAEAQVNSLSDESSDSTIDSTITRTKEALRSVADALLKTRTLLDNSITGTGFSLADFGAKKSTIDTDRTSVNGSLSTLESNESTINSTKLTNQTNIDLAGASVTGALGALQTAEDQLAFKKASPREADINFYRAQVNQAEASLDLILKQIADATLKAPVEGVVTKVNFEVGEVITMSELATTSIVSLISANNFEIEADVSELDINKIKINDPTDVSIDAISETEVFRGKVVQVDPAEILKDSDIYYRIKVILDDKTISLKSGMTADISIVTNVKSGVIIIPERAIIKEGGKKNVRLLVGDQINTVEVETGLKGDEMIEIISGVKAGDKVVTYIKE